MEWLMGKARGVSRGLMSTTPTTNSPSEPVPPVTVALLQTICRSNSPNADTTANCEAADVKSPLASQRPVPVTTPAGVAKSASPSASPLTDWSSVPRSPIDQSLSEDALHHQRPFLRPCYLKQQLPLVTNNSKVDTDFPALVEPLPTLDVNEWIAAHTIGLFENLSTIFDAIYELCTCDSLQSSSWSDNENEEHLQVVSGAAEDSPPSDTNPSPPPPAAAITTKKSARGRAFKKPPQTARQAIIVALSECNDIIQSSRVFPIKKGQPFPSDLPSESAKICKKLLFCLSHLYMSHFRHLEQLDLIAHMNTLAKHFFAFTTRFSLIEDCDLGPLNGFHHTLLACPAPILNQKSSSVAVGNTVASTVTTTACDTLLPSVPS